MFRRERKGLIVLALLMAFAAGPGAAEAAGGGAREGAGLWSRLLGWLGAQAGMVTATWGDVGPYIDPNGRPQSTANGDEGPIIDPNGRPQSTANGDVGPYIDPDGQPR
jgi:hypothetical protein